MSQTGLLMVQIIQARKLKKIKGNSYFVLVFGVESHRIFLGYDVQHPKYQNSFTFHWSLIPRFFEPVNFVQKLTVECWDTLETNSPRGSAEVQILLKEEYLNQKIQSWFMLGDDSQQYQGEFELSVVCYTDEHLSKERLSALRVVDVQCDIIIAPNEFNIENGLSGLKRNVVLRLIQLISFDNVSKIKKKAIMGISAEHYLWLKHPHFLNMVKESVRYMSVSHSKSFHISGLDVHAFDNLAMFFEMKNPVGIYNLKLQFAARKKGDTSLKKRKRPEQQEKKRNDICIGVGVSRLKDVNMIMKKPFPVGGTNTGAAYILKSENGSIRCNDGGGDLLPSDFCFHDGVIVCVEVDMSPCTMCFFRDGVQIPYTVLGIPSDVVFGYSCSPHILVHFVSMTAPSLPSTDAALACRTFSWSLV